jgi:hypothetical protein
MIAPKRRSTHLELVRSSEAEVEAAFYTGRLFQQASAPALPKAHVKALWFLTGLTAGLLVAAIILVSVRWLS